MTKRRANGLWTAAWRWLWWLPVLALTGCSWLFGGDDDDKPEQPPPAPPPATAIVTQPQPATVPDGSTATFSVVASGTSLAYQWQRNGSTIAGATGTSYTTPANTLADSGAAFTVVVSGNGSSVTSSAAALTVTALAPTITHAPVALAVTDGQPVDFSVQATGSAPLSYQWYRDGTPLAGATSDRYRIDSAQLADNGAVFSVAVSGPGGTTASSGAALTVTEAAVPPSVVTAPQDVTVNAGQTASFTVVASGSQPLAYQWQKNGADIAGANASAYTTPPTTLADQGATFRVQVSNAAGRQTSAAATLSVNALIAPSIQVHPVPQSVAAGQTAAFSVVADGSAPLAYQWLRNGVPISGATAASYTTGALALADSGAAYSVNVTNGTGVVATSSAAVLTVTAVQPPGELNPADYLVAGRAGDQTASLARAFLSIADPANPGTPKTASQLLAIESEIAVPRSRTRNSAGEIVAGPAPYVYFIKDGMIYKVDLKRGADTTPVRISSATNACALGGSIAVSADAADAWIFVRTTGTVGGCGSSVLAAVRSTASTTTAPVLIANTLGILGVPPLIDMNNRLLGMLVRQVGGPTIRLRVLAADMQAVSDVENSSGLTISSGDNAIWPMGGDATEPQSFYVRIGREMRRLSWAGGQARISANLYSFIDTTLSVTSVSDSSGNYFVDIGYLLRARGESPATLLKSFDASEMRFGIITNLLLTPSQVVVQHGAVFNVDGAIAMVGKSGDTRSTLVAPIAGRRVVALGTKGDQVVYSVTDARSYGELRVIRETESAGESIASAVKLVANMPARELPPGAAGPIAVAALQAAQLEGAGPPLVSRLEGVLYCRPATGTTHCANAPLYRYDVASRASVQIAQFTDGLTQRSTFELGFDYLGGDYSLYAGLPGSLYVSASGSGTAPEGGFVSLGLWADRYALGIGTAAPLVRATRLVP